MPTSHPASSSSTGEQLLRSLQVVAAELERLRGERVSTVSTLAQHWVGGHRLSYEAALDAFEVQSRRLTESVYQLLAMQHRLVVDAETAVATPAGLGAAIPYGASWAGVGQ